jgi:hypothetical protein
MVELKAMRQMSRRGIQHSFEGKEWRVSRSQDVRYCALADYTICRA